MLACGHALVTAAWPVTRSSKCGGACGRQVFAFPCRAEGIPAILSPSASESGVSRRGSNTRSESSVQSHTKLPSLQPTGLMLGTILPASRPAVWPEDRHNEMAVTARQPQRSCQQHPFQASRASFTVWLTERARGGFLLFSFLNSFHSEHGNHHCARM